MFCSLRSGDAAGQLLDPAPLTRDKIKLGDDVLRYDLYILRFLLGAAEGGFFPGILFYLTLWFPDRTPGRMTIPSGYLEGSAAVGGIALISAIGSLGGAVCPAFVGWVTVRTGSLYTALSAVALLALSE